MASKKPAPTKSIAQQNKELIEKLSEGEKEIDQVFIKELDALCKKHGRNLQGILATGEGQQTQRFQVGQILSNAFRIDFTIVRTG